MKLLNIIVSIMCLLCLCCDVSATSQTEGNVSAEANQLRDSALQFYQDYFFHENTDLDKIAPNISLDARLHLKNAMEHSPAIIDELEKTPITDREVSDAKRILENKNNPEKERKEAAMVLAKYRIQKDLNELKKLKAKKKEEEALGDWVAGKFLK